MNAPMKRSHQSIRTHDDGTFGKLVVSLTDSLEVVSSRIRLTDGSRGEVHDLVTVVAVGKTRRAVSKGLPRRKKRGSRRDERDIGVELCDSKVSPISSNGSKDVTESVGPVKKRSW